MKPLVTVVIGTYNPNIDWLRKQLQSIEKQSYKNIEVLAVDDCSLAVSFEEIKHIFIETFHDIPFNLSRNTRNIGTSKTYEALTCAATGQYIAFCDQDDLWEINKIQKLLDTIIATEAQLCYSDLSVIDQKGNTTAKTLKSVRKRIKHLYGENLAYILLFRNFINGCTMIMRAETAKAAMPFVDMAPDHWLALYAASRGKIAYIPEQLIKYRIHCQNQSAILRGVTSRDDYYRIRIIPICLRFERYKERFSGDVLLNPFIDNGLKWSRARREYFNGRWGAGLRILKYANLNIYDSIFELFGARLPAKIFNFLIEKIRTGKL